MFASQPLGVDPTWYQPQQNEAVLYVQGWCGASKAFKPEWDSVKDVIEKLQAKGDGGIGFPGDFRMVALETFPKIERPGVPYVVIRYNGEELPLPQTMLRDKGMLFYILLNLFYWHKLAEINNWDPSELRTKPQYLEFVKAALESMTEEQKANLFKFHRLL